jgi:hypothetical protein
MPRHLTYMGKARAVTKLEENCKIVIESYSIGNM